MKNLFKSPPILIPKERRAIIWAASCFFILGLFGLFTLLATMIWVIESVRTSTTTQIADILLGPLSWLYTCIFTIPALILAWPCANLALRIGYAGWATAVTICSVLFTLCSALAEFPTIGFGMFYFGIGSGIGFGTLYWLSAYLKFPDAFDSTLPESI